MQHERENDRQSVLTHVGVLTCMAASTAVLYWRPEWVLRLPLACVMRSWLGVRCPFCGMTRDFVDILHGRSPTLNVFSWPVAVVVYVVYPLMVLWLWRRRRLDWFFRPVVRRAVAVGLVLMFAVNNLAK
jgi:hypothetical protein